ncbi:MAG TPA: hypothetical protein VN429_11415 [Methanospirillum sp.]|uniref:hypothetical protein n=1 Tax=Methanospirillum sp. TaxID=45200 RepID=UPI002CA56FC6|nr:hypothetical protein [Methanospirillum sp.]HWQ65017.1 hypothetical protein [Methanospirillum sp.]
MELEQFTGELTPLSESVNLDESGTMDIKIIGPGWGSSGYYSADLLRKSVDKYNEGLQNFIDHPTPIQERERPERSLRDLASVQVSSARFEESGFAGPGIYAKVKVFPEFHEMIKSRAPYIGMSHRAEGSTKLGEAEGRKGKLIESIQRVHSVDYVTRPGAGGALGTLTESKKTDMDDVKPDIVTLSRDDYKAQLKESADLKSENAQLKEALEESKKLGEENNTLKAKIALMEAGSVVSSLVSASKIPEIMRPKLIESLIIKVAGKTAEEIKTLTEAEIKDQLEMVVKLTESGKVTGMGSTQPPTTTMEEAQKNLINTFMRTGMSESAAKIAAGVRV